MQVQTIADLKRAMAVKLSLTSKGYKATVKADTPDEAIALATKAHTMLLDLKARLAAPAEKDRSDYPVLVCAAEATTCQSCNGSGKTSTNSTKCWLCEGKGEYPPKYLLKHGGGAATPWDPRLQKLTDDFVVKIDLELNSKGIGWDVEVKAYPMEAGVALIEYTERALAEAFNPSAETKGA